MVIDDQDMSLDAIKHLIEETGFKGIIKLFSSSHEALEFIRQFTIEERYKRSVDLVITEFKMPEMTGLEVIEEVKTFLELISVKSQRLSKHQRLMPTLLATTDVKPPIFFICSGYQLPSFV